MSAEAVIHELPGSTTDGPPSLQKLAQAGCAATALVGATASRSRASRRARRDAGASRKRGALLSRAAQKPGAGGAIDTFLVKGPVDVAKLSMRCAPLANHFDVTCVVFFSQGVKADLIASAAGGALGLHGVCPIYIADCDGVVGFDVEAGANSYLHGDNQGVVVAAFRGGGHQPSCMAVDGEKELPEDKALHMVVTARESSEAPEAPQKLRSRATGGAVYGGLARECFMLEHSGELVSVPQFAVSTPMAVLTSFDGDAQEAASAALEKLPKVAAPPIAAGYFSTVGDEEKSPAALEAGGLEGVRLFGMSSPDTFGPPAGPPIACTPELTTWFSIMDPDPRPSVEMLPDQGSTLALYGK